jgi:hypothetical protein
MLIATTSEFDIDIDLINVSLTVRHRTFLPVGKPYGFLPRPKKEAARSSETLVPIHTITWYLIPEDRYPGFASF